MSEITDLKDEKIDIDKKTSKETVTTEQTQKNSSKTSQLIYCGPNLPNGILNRFTVYRDGYPKHLEPHFEECPAIKRLFVPIEDFAKTMSSIEQRGSAEHVWFEQIVKHFKGGVES
jgi:hypothetical protein